MRRSESAVASSKVHNNVPYQDFTRKSEYPLSSTAAMLHNSLTPRNISIKRTTLPALPNTAESS